jgi:hypothetical protein
LQILFSSDKLDLPYASYLKGIPLIFSIRTQLKILFLAF